MKINERINIYKIIKISIGCCLSIAIAMTMGLNNTTSAGIITLLSIQNTKKETLNLAFQRLGSFVVALVIAFICFTIIGYNIWSFGMYLLIFIAFCHYFRLEAVISICSVLITHFWIKKSMHLLLVQNEFFLLIIGTSIGVMLNLFLSKQTEVIRQTQEQIEDIMRNILHKMADIIENKQTADYITIDMTILDKSLNTALIQAYDTMNNSLISNMRYYVQYVNLRRSQYTVLHRIWENLSKLTFVPDQALILSEHFRKISISFHEYNNAVDLLKDWDYIRYNITREDLPKTREEFEARAVLFQVFNDIESLLLLKNDFSQSLTEEQKKEFWSN